MTRIGTDHQGTTRMGGRVRIGIAGCTGRMGATIAREILSGHGSDIVLAAGTVKPDFPDSGIDIGVHLGQAPAGILIGTDPESLFDSSDVVIDFTAPEATRHHVWLAAKHRKPLVIGTTGLSSSDHQEIQDAARETALLQSANMSVGINVLLALVAQAAARLEEDSWDIEIFETHHRHKLDAPSGTALALGQAVAKGRNSGADLATLQIPAGARETTRAARPAGGIGFSVARGGNVAGEHSVLFLGESERVELCHRATDRAIFARGALRAAQWLKNRPAGLYSMQDVLGF